MKNILLLTDFSEASEQAASYAVHLANGLGCNITLFHVYQVYSTTGSFLSVERYMVADIEKDMARMLKQVEASLQPGLKAEAKYMKGETIPTLARIAESKAYDLVIMGNHGEGARTSIFWGTTTSGVVEKTSSDILAIPDVYAFQQLKNIVLIVDDESFSSEQILAPLPTIARAFDAKIWIYHDNPEEEVNKGVIKQKLEGLTCEYYAEASPEESRHISEFIKEKEADLICMIKHDKGFWARFFQSSMAVTVQQLFNIPLPVLVLKDN